MKQSLFKIFKTSTFRYSSVTFIATIINGALGAIFFICVARFLGPSDYGLFTVSMATLTLTADIGNLGTDTGIVNFVSRYIKTDSVRAYKFMKLALKTKFVVGMFISITGIFFAETISERVFHKPELGMLLQIAFIGVFAQLLFTFATSALQSFQKFTSWGAVNIGQNSIRLIFLFAVYAVGAVSTSNMMLLYALIPFAGFIIGMILLPRAFLSIKKENEIAKDFFTYNLWVAGFGAIAALSSRLDTFIAARLLDSTQLGIYGAANQLVQVVPQLVSSLGTVIAPKMAQQNSKDKFISYLKKTQVMISGLVLFGILSIPIVLYIIPYLFGSEFISTGSVFIILLFSMLIFLLSVPLHMSVLYYFSYPKLFFWLSLGHLVLIGLIGWNLIPMYGVIGAAWTVLLGQIYNFAVPGVWVVYQLKRK